jgi:hypothetical protein
MTSTDIFIEKFIWLNYNQLLGEIAHLSKQKQIYGIVMRKYEQPEDLTENDTTAEKFPKCDEAQNWVNQHDTAQSMILLSMELQLQAKYQKIMAVQTVLDKLVMADDIKLQCNVFQISDGLVGIHFKDGDDVDSYAVWIDQTVNDWNLCLDLMTLLLDMTRIFGKLTDKEHVLYLLHGIQRNQDWQ